MSTGVAVNDQCLEVFNELKLGKKYSYIIYKLNESMTEIIVEKTADAGAPYTEFIGCLPANDCRYCVFDFKYDHNEGGERNKILFVSWSPDDAKIRAKMTYAGSKDAIRRKLVGVHTEIQATDYSEVAQDTVLEKVSRV